MQSQNAIVGWIALILAVIAIILAWVAFNRSGADLEAVMMNEMDRRAAEFRVDFEEMERELRMMVEDAATDDDTETATTTP